MSEEACHLLASSRFCSSLPSLHGQQLEMFKRKCVFQHRNTTNLSVKPLCLGRYKGVSPLALVREGVGAELAVHQVANNQNDINAVYRASFQASTNTCIFFQADRGCVSNCLAQNAVGRSSAGAALRCAIWHVLQTIIKCMFSVVAFRILAHKVCVWGWHFFFTRTTLAVLNLIEL